MKRTIFLGNIKYENPKIANSACYVEIRYEQKTENKWVFAATGEIWNKNGSDIYGGVIMRELAQYTRMAEEIKAEYSNENTVVYLIKECLIPAYREYRGA